MDMSKNLKPLTTDGSIMGPADKVCSCPHHWNHDDCTDQCSHMGTGDGCNDAAGSEVAQVRKGECRGNGDCTC